MNDKQKEILYKILAICHYNGERRQITHALLRGFLTSMSESFNIDNELKKQQEKPNVKRTEEEIKSFNWLFEEFDYMITAGLSPEAILDYIVLRYSTYDQTLQKKHGLTVGKFSYIAYHLLLSFGKHSGLNAPLEIYEYESKKQYADLKFVAKPTEDYIRRCQRLNSISITELLKDEKLINKADVEIFLSLYSFEPQEYNSKKDIRFKEYPLIRDNETIILIDQSYFIKYLPHKIDLLLKQSKSYDSSKGKVFENMALDLIEKFPFTNVHRNIVYDEFEVDGILNMRKSTWFVECKSRNINPESLKGNGKKITKDIEKALITSLKQGERAVQNKEHKAFKKFNIHRRVGIIIIVEGIFPNIRMPEILFKNPIDNSSYPVCVFNYFELNAILNQPDNHVLEEFLIWRSQKGMPIYCHDECDYWAFFNDNYRKHKEIKKAWQSMKDRKITTNYISARFNKKDYMRKMVKNE